MSAPAAVRAAARILTRTPGWPLVARLGRWVWAARWRRVLVRSVAVYHLVGVLCLLITAPARAQVPIPDGAAPDPGVPVNMALSWMDVKDSHNISVWRYYMSLDHGNARDPLKGAYAYAIEVEFEIYRAIAATTIWILTFALKFEWLDSLVSPARSVGASLTALTGQMNVAGVLLTAAALVGGCWMLRGRWAGGIYEVVVACLIAVLAVGALSDPIDRVAGSDGLIIQTRDAGLELAAGITHQGDTGADPNDMVVQLSQALTDTMVRGPAQILNFGVRIDSLTGDDGQKCIEAWDRGLDAYKGNTRDTLKDNIRKCEGGGSAFWQSNGGSMKAYADDPGPSQVAAGAALILGGLVWMVFGWLLAFTIFATVGTALFQAIKAIPMLLFGIAPGAPRGALWKIAATVAMSLTTLMFAIVFTAAYMIVIKDFFSDTSSNLFRRIFMVDLVLIIGAVTFRRGVRALRSYSDVLASKLAARPGGGGPSPIQRSTPNAGMLQRAYYATWMAKRYQSMATSTAHSLGRIATSHAGAAITGTRIAAGAAGAVATGGTTAAVSTAWKVAKTAAGGTRILAAAARSSDPHALMDEKLRKTPAKDGSDKQLVAYRQHLNALANPPATPRKDSRGQQQTRLATFGQHLPPTPTPTQRRAPRPRPEERYAPGIKRQVAVATPLPTAARSLPRETRTSSGLWVPGSAASTPPPVPSKTASARSRSSAGAKSSAVTPPVPRARSRRR